MTFHYGLSIVLGILSIIDWKRKYFTKRELYIVAVVVLICSTVTEVSGWNRIAGSCLGIVLVVFSILSSEQLGKGDAFLLLICGCAAGIYHMTALLTITFGITSMIGSFLLWCKKIKKTTRIPFVPFLFVAQLILCIVGTMR